jgi:pectate lyase
VSLTQGTAAAGDIRVGVSRGESPTLTIAGGTLTVALILALSDYSGSRGLLELNSGALHVGGSIYIGGVNYYDPVQNHSQGTFRIRGGSVNSRWIILGGAQGSEGTLEIIGSVASRIDVLDYLMMGTTPFKLERPSTSTLSFVLDGRGVTPIVIHHKSGGLSLYDRGGANTFHLRIGLSAVPPSGDILLVRTRRPIRGTFTDLPEGAPIRATFGNRTFQWKLTYRGGPNQHDLMLTTPCEVMRDGRVVARTDGAAVIRPREVSRAGRIPPVQPLPDDNPPAVKTLAFPGAEGYGAPTPGGRGGKVLLVTNLNDSGPGSLRAAIETMGARTVLFRTGGIIQLKSTLVIREPYLTVAGQTAPGDGICLRGEQVILQDTHDVILRHLRLRPGRVVGELDCLRAHSSEHFILDHLSMSWSSDKAIVTSEFSDHFTVQRCLISESFNHKGHAFAMIAGGIHSSWHHNLLADHISRNPRLSILSRCDWRNNVIYNWGHTAAYGELTWVNYVNNYFQPGPSTTQKPPFFFYGDCTVAPRSFFAAGNVMAGSPELTADNWRGITFEPEVRASLPFSCPAVKTQTAQEAYASVLNDSGATLPHRDPIDRRIMEEVRAGRGRIILHENDVGGYPAYAAGTPAVDSDGDGIPDTWEIQHGLKPHDPIDANIRADGSGYTNLERYLNSISPGRTEHN